MKQGEKLSIKENRSYFLTMTVVDWIDAFSRKVYCDFIIDSLKYCIAEKGLNVYAYVIMSNHLHLIANCNEPFELKDTIRDFKKYTAKRIIAEVKSGVESRKEWMICQFEKAGSETKKNKNYKFWQTGNHAIELYSSNFTWNKINYIHQNPVRAGYVNNPEDWKYSSATNYADKENNRLNEVVCITPKQITV